MGAHLAKIQPHAAAKLGDVGEVGNAVINPLQVIGHRINKAGAELMVGFPGVGEGGGGHGDQQLA